MTETDVIISSDVGNSVGISAALFECFIISWRWCPQWPAEPSRRVESLQRPPRLLLVGHTYQVLLYYVQLLPLLLLLPALPQPSLLSLNSSAFHPLLFPLNFVLVFLYFTILFPFVQISECRTLLLFSSR